MITEVGNSTEPEHSLENRKFKFRALTNAKFTGFDAIQDNLFRWGMQQTSYILKFSYDQFFQPYEIKTFLIDFFNDPEVNGRIRVIFCPMICNKKVLGSQDRWGSVGKVSSVNVEETSHTITSLSFFDKLYKSGKHYYHDAE